MTRIRVANLPFKSLSIFSISMCIKKCSFLYYHLRHPGPAISQCFLTWWCCTLFGDKPHIPSACTWQSRDPSSGAKCVNCGLWIKKCLQWADMVRVTSVICVGRRATLLPHIRHLTLFSFRHTAWRTWVFSPPVFTSECWELPII